MVLADGAGSGWPNFAPTYDLIRSSGDRSKAVNLLSKSTADQKKKAGRPLFNMTAQLIAARLSYSEGATTNIRDAVLLDGKYELLTAGGPWHRSAWPGEQPPPSRKVSAWMAVPPTIVSIATSWHCRSTAPSSC